MKYLLYLLITGLIANHFFMLMQYSVNIPAMDDFDAILKFAAEYKSSEGLKRFMLLFERHNEHIILPVRVVTATLLLFGPLNFLHFIFIGNLLLIGIPVVIFFKEKSVYKPFYLLLAYVFILNAGSFENTYWAMASIQNYGVLFLAALSIFSLGKRKEKVLISFILSLFTSISSGNGFVVLALIFIILAIQDYKKVYLYLWVFGSLLIMFLLFVNYQSPPGNPGIINTLIEDLDLIIPHYLVLVGNHFNWVFIKILAGLIILVCILVIFTDFNLRKFTEVKVLIVFCLISCSFVSLTRSFYGVEQATSSRYMIYSSLIVVLMTILAAKSFTNRKIFKTDLVLISMLIVGGITYAYNLKVIDIVKAQKDRLIHSAALKYDTKDELVSYFYPDQNIARDILRKADKLGIYLLPSVQTYNFNSTVIDSIGKIEYEVVRVETKDSVHLEGYAIIRGAHSKDVKVVLSSASDTSNVNFNTSKIFVWGNYIREGYIYGVSGYKTKSLTHSQWADLGEIESFSLKVQYKKVSTEVQVDRCEVKNTIRL